MMTVSFAANWARSVMDRRFTVMFVRIASRKSSKERNARGTIHAWNFPRVQNLIRV